MKVWMILAPREKPEINQTIDAFRKAGFKQKIHIFAEPGEYDIKDKNVELEIHKEKKWCFKNFDYALKKLLEKKDDYYLMLQDDFLLNKQAKKKIEQVMHLKWQDFWFINLNTRKYEDYVKHHVYKEWRNQNEIGWLFSPAFFLFSRQSAFQIINHPFYQNHRENYEKNRQVDCCVAETCKQLWLEMLVHNPSLSVQRWETSTLWHNPKFIQEKEEYKECEKVIGWMCSIPEREESLKYALKSILLQVDKLYITLNWYTEVPERLKEHQKYFDIDIRLTDNSRWDIEKFYWVDKEEWYFFCFDDDFEYTPTYTKKLIRKIDEYKKKAVIWMHWARIIQPIKWYYKSRRVFWYNKEQEKDYEVNILWTWTIWFHTSAINIDTSKWELANATDLLLWIEWQKQWVSFINIKHDWTEMKLNEEVQENSIRQTKRNNDEAETELAKSINWTEKRRESKEELPVKQDDKIRVKFLKPVGPYKSWEIAYIPKKKADYHKKRVKKLEDKDNKAILSNKFNKWL